jgi:hypothetical protein
VSIKIGSKVRSFDFESRDLTGQNSFYVEGVVVDISDMSGNGRYSILVEKQIFRGEEANYHVGTIVYPPVNGQFNIVTGNKTDGVELL